MQITLINCNAKLLAKGIDHTDTTGQWSYTLTSDFQGILPNPGWSYDPVADKLEIMVADGTAIPASLSNYGDVVT